MRKAKVVAIVCGIIGSCLIGGFAVVDAATITLDDSSTTELVECTEAATEAATETSIETTAPVRECTEPVEETQDTTEETETTAPETTTATETTAAEATDAEETETETAEETTEPADPTEDADGVTAEQMPDEFFIKNGNYVEEPVSYDMPAVEEPTAVDGAWTYYVSERDYILLCNAVGHEAGADMVPVVEKAKVVEVIMNRVYSDIYPNDVYSVLTQKNQFTGASTYVDLGTYSPKVSDMVREAVDLYFSDPSQFNHGYIGFWGDGQQNHFS